MAKKEKKDKTSKKEKKLLKEDYAQRNIQKLRGFNLIMGFLHLIQGIFMIVISNDTTYPVYTNYLNYDNVLTSGVVPDPKVLFEVPFGIAVAIFLLLSAVAHFALGTFAYKWYSENLRKGMNPARFYEYALSSSLMVVLIGMLNGVWDFYALILMFGVNAMMNLFGIVMEKHNQTTKKTDWTAFVFGTFAGVFPWIAIVGTFIGTLSRSDAKPPDFVYFILPTIFVFFNIFAVNMVLQYKKVGKWKNYLYGERMYIILSLLAKTALAWQIFAGTLAPI